MKYHIYCFTENKKGIMLGEHIKIMSGDFINACKITSAISSLYDMVKIYDDNDDIVIYRDNLIWYDNKVYYVDEFIKYLETIHI